MVMEPSPQCVGREFVKQYYTILNQAPNFLHRFYSHDSSFVHSGMEQSGDEQSVVVGQAEIHKQISLLNFHDCHTRIRQVDSQATVGDGVVIQVIGELANNNGAMRPFVQTFVLASQSAKKYYVHNDIFRYQDDVFHANGPTTDPGFAGQHNHMDTAFSEAGSVEVETGSGQSSSLDVHHSAVNFHQEAPLTPPLSNGLGHPADEISFDEAAAHGVTPVAETAAEPLETLKDQMPLGDESFEQMGTADDAVKLAEDDVISAAAEQEPVTTDQSQQETAFEQEVEELEQEVEVKPAKPMTWAAMASKTPTSSSVKTPASSSAGRAAKPQPVAMRSPPEQKPDATPVTAKPKVVANQELSDQDGGSRAQSSLDGEDGRRPSIPPQVFPDNQQVFVGNLPQYLSDKELHEFFGHYGTILDMKINRKSSNVNHLPNFGFIVFESPETVREVLSHRPLYMNAANGKHRINVEEKKARAELAAARPRSASRGGIRPSGYGRGADNLGRGGVRPAGPTS